MLIEFSLKYQYSHKWQVHLSRFGFPVKCLLTFQCTLLESYVLMAALSLILLLNIEHLKNIDTHVTRKFVLVIQLNFLAVLVVMVSARSAISKFIYGEKAVLIQLHLLSCAVPVISTTDLSMIPDSLKIFISFKNSKQYQDNGKNMQKVV